MSELVGRLAVVSAVVHYEHGGRLYAYGAYAREIDAWATLARDVVIVAPRARARPPADALPFAARNLRVRAVPATGGDALGPRLVQAVRVPELLGRVAWALRDADAVHVRCPANLGLIGAVVAPLRSRRLVAKYASLWGGYAGEPLSYRLQRALLASRWWCGPVTVYGEWPGQPPHVVPFFTSVLSAEQVARARTAALRPRSWRPLHVLYVGRLARAKNVHVLLDALAAVRRDGVDARLTVVGDGPERPALESQADALGLGAHAAFTGGLAVDAVLGHYECADVLVLASDYEGWPKAIAEAMAFGVTCIGADRGFVPHMLGGGRGLLVPPRDAAALAGSLRTIAADPVRFEAVRARGAAWAQRHSLDELRDAIEALLRRAWASERGEGGAPAGFAGAARP